MGYTRRGLQGHLADVTANSNVINIKYGIRLIRQITNKGKHIDPGVFRTRGIGNVFYIYQRLLCIFFVDDKIKDYIVDLVLTTRDPAGASLPDLAPLIEYGGSPRASIALTKAAKGHAFLRRRGYVTPEDVKAVAMDVLRHRVIVTYEAEAEDVTAEDVVQQVLDHVEVP